MSWVEKSKGFIKKIFSKADSIRGILAILIFLIGIILGFYYGVIVMFIGGIIDVITAIAADPILTGQLTVGILKFLLSEVVGFGIFFAGCAIAYLVGESSL